VRQGGREVAQKEHESVAVRRETEPEEVPKETGNAKNRHNEGPRLTSSCARLNTTDVRFRVQIYSSELEAQPEFNGFREWLLPFDLYRGKKTGDDVEDEARIVGTFKVITGCRGRG